MKQQTQVLHGMTWLGQRGVIKWDTENVIISMSSMSGAHPSFVVIPMKLRINILSPGWTCLFKLPYHFLLHFLRNS